MKIIIGEGVTYVCFEQWERGGMIEITSGNPDKAMIVPGNIEEAARALAMLAADARRSR